jgi:hypothetical protein
MDQYKSPEVARRVTRIVAGERRFWPADAGGPGTPPDRLKTLRDAYAKAMRDPGLIEEAKKGQMDMEYTPGEELQSYDERNHESARRSDGPGKKASVGVTGAPHRLLPKDLAGTSNG